MCVLISEADGVLYFTTALPAPDFFPLSPHAPGRPGERAGVRMWLSLSLFSLSSARCSFLSCSKDKPGLQLQLGVGGDAGASLRFLSFEGVPAATAGKEIGGCFCSVGGGEGFSGEILPALQQIRQANQGRRRRSSKNLPLSLWPRQSCQTHPWASCFSCAHLLPGKASRKTPDMQSWLWSDVHAKHPLWKAKQCLLPLPASPGRG